jgi:hypothetical protein
MTFAIERCVSLAAFIVHRRAGVLFAAATVALGALAGTPARPASSAVQASTAAVSVPRQLRRLDFDHLRYAGAFRLPAGESQGESFAYGGSTIAINAERNSLFVSTNGGRVAEVSIPTLVKSARIDELPFAEYVQPFADPAEGRTKEAGDQGVALAGLLVYEGRLFGSAVIYYDATHTQTVSHFFRSLSLVEKSASALHRVGDRGQTGFVAGYMAAVPVEWRTLLGGTALTGQCCLPIISRTSLGPSAWVWDPRDLVKGSAAPARSLVHYDADHPTLGAWRGSNATYGGTTMIGGVAVINGTRTALFLGTNGVGPFCYGTGTPEKAIADKKVVDGEEYCYDPANPYKGQHAYPYRYQMWAYDLNDWVSVKTGKRDPWEVVPYGVWPFELPFREPTVRIGGVAYDAIRRLLYFSQLKADQDGYAYRPIIHAYYIP